MTAPLTQLSEHEVIVRLRIQGPLIALFGRCSDIAANAREPEQPHVCLMVTGHHERWHMCACGTRWPTPIEQ